MTYKGIMRGNTIVLEDAPHLAEGTPVDVEIAARETAAPRPESPQAALALAGTLTREEADFFNQISAEMRRVDPKMWK